MKYYFHGLALKYAKGMPIAPWTKGQGRIDPPESGVFRTDDPV